MSGKRAKRWTERVAVRDAQRGLDWAHPPTVDIEPGESIWQSADGLGHYTDSHPWASVDKRVRRLGETVRLIGTVRGYYDGEGAQLHHVSAGHVQLTEVALVLIENGRRA